MLKKGLILIGFLVIFSPMFVLGLMVPNSQIKTVEFFVGQNGTQLPNTTAKTYGFGFAIPETGVAKRYGWFEIGGISTGTFDQTFGVNLSNIASDIYSIDSAGETQEYTIRYIFQPQINSGANGPYILGTNLPTSSDIRSAESAKLILTYEYDSTSPRQLKTVRYFVGQNNNSLGTSSRIQMPFSVYLPENNIIVKSAFIEVQGVSLGGVDNTIYVNTTNGPTLAVSIDSSAATEPYTILYNASELYSITSPGFNSYTLNVNNTGENQTLLGATAVITYEYDANSTEQVKTIRYQAMELNNSYATNTIFSQAFKVPIAESRFNIRSAWIKFNGWVTVDTTINASIDNANHVFAFLDILTEGTHFTFLHNATPLYSLTTAGDYGPYTLRYRLTGPTTTVPMAQLYLTYNYSTNTTLQTKTIESAYFTDDVQRAANIDLDRSFFIITPENNITMKNVYMESSSVASSTGVTHILTAGFGDNPLPFVKSTTGETTYTYILRNATDTTYASSKGTNGAFTLFRQDNGISSLTSGEVITTYFFQ